MATVLTMSIYSTHIPHIQYKLDFSEVVCTRGFHLLRYIRNSLYLHAYQICYEFGTCITINVAYI